MMRMRKINRSGSKETTRNQQAERRNKHPTIQQIKEGRFAANPNQEKIPNSWINTK